ncbi:energy-coupling factor transporter transmembrane protein EcfT [Mumia zhuanghuii]|uniref:Energy-coupling factor transporter transmembrane component T n=2 Tax=Mumia TaxID=1546255 RepID=A0ABW1QTU6_9ACTN|nr:MULTISPECIES: energy-coupling factor transporter transmembrane component T [Mumia]KAA1424515.1 energy-coupling factor transporter transmembrane protein EcfT [Mumia zhuanghuii]
MRRLVVDANPLVLLLVGFAAVVASLAVRDLRTGVIALTAYAVAGAVLLPSLRFALLRFVAVGVASVSVVWSTWLLGGHDAELALTAGLRIVVLALPGAVLAAFLDPSRLADQMGQRLHVPARFVVAFAAALQRFSALREVWVQLDRARRARGFGPTRNPVSLARHGGALAFAMLVAALRDAGRMSAAMDARGFADARTRTWAEPAPWTRADSGLLALGLFLALVPWLVR